MTFKEIQDLIKAFAKSNLAEVQIKDGEFEIKIKAHKESDKDHPQMMLPAPPTVSHHPQVVHSAQAPVAPPPAPAPAAEPASSASEEKEKTNYVEIKSPIVGTFYRSPSPDKDPFVTVGDSVDVGSVVCIVEAMKLFNEIESEVKGKIVKVLVDDATPIEYDQALFLVDPNG